MNTFNCTECNTAHPIPPRGTDITKLECTSCNEYLAVLCSDCSGTYLPNDLTPEGRCEECHEEHARHLYWAKRRAELECE